MRVLIFGSGVIGRIYAARFLAAGLEVVVLSRGAAADQLRQTGIVLRKGQRTAETVFPRIVENTVEAGPIDIALVTVRGDQVDAALLHIASIQARVVASLVNLPRGLDTLAEVVGPDRCVAAFPGVAGRLDNDGIVTYIEVPQQPTMVGLSSSGATDTSSPQGEVLALLKSAGFPTATTLRMPAWLQTHAIFIAAFESAIAATGDVMVLAADRSAVRNLVQAVREGFAALEARGTTTTPPVLRVLFLRMPVWFATTYWCRQLRGELGRLGLAPHAISSRHTELPALQHVVRALLAGANTPKLESIFAGTR
ncbi:ketopantoate reductase family protein [Glaciihabitans sp. GrIS 2.15]|uniref:ketopantoate reductase family protein n=1 Tax=Glaciihabitans sp. GrIS 2.15 TaxID=3071710 RepID=UPI002DFB4D28|nr:2-dehydropantoate 2-reductase [Glaciihabitans sp. GrIS 2.15]